MCLIYYGISLQREAKDSYFDKNDCVVKINRFFFLMCLKYWTGDKILFTFVSLKILKLEILQFLNKCSYFHVSVTVFLYSKKHWSLGIYPSIQLQPHVMNSLVMFFALQFLTLKENNFSQAKKKIIYQLLKSNYVNINALNYFDWIYYYGSP